MPGLFLFRYAPEYPGHICTTYRDGGANMIQNRVKEYRVNARLTLTQLADRAGVPVSTINDVERGAEPRVVTAIRIARALNVRVERLWPL